MPFLVLIREEGGKEREEDRRKGAGVCLQVRVVVEDHCPP